VTYFSMLIGLETRQ